MVITLLVVFVGFPTLSWAGEDAYFCNYKGYFAYETHEGVTPGVVGHVLRVVRFESKRGIYLAGEVTLPEFTVYLCFAKTPAGFKISKIPQRR